jgi:hypothetical protein
MRTTAQELYERLTKVVTGERTGDGRTAAINLVAMMLVTGAKDWDEVEQRVDTMCLALKRVAKAQWGEVRKVRRKATKKPNGRRLN